MFIKASDKLPVLKDMAPEWSWQEPASLQLYVLANVTSNKVQASLLPNAVL